MEVLLEARGTGYGAVAGIKEKAAFLPVRKPPVSIEFLSDVRGEEPAAP